MILRIKMKYKKYLFAYHSIHIEYILYIKCSLTHILYKFLLLPFINISNQK